MRRSTCKTCHTFKGVKARDPKTGYKHLFAAIRVRNAGIVEVTPDFERPHKCSAPATIDEKRVRDIVSEEVAIWLQAPSPSPSVSANPAPVATESVPLQEKVSAVSPATLDQVRAVVAQQMAATGPGYLEILKGYVQGEISNRIKPVTERIVVLQRSNGQTEEIVGHHHPLFPRLLRYVQAGQNVYLHGAPGGGKSTAARQVATVLDRRYGYISLAPMTPESRVVGFLDASGQYRGTPFYECYTQGGVFCIDEMDNANDALLTALNGALENGRAAFPCGVVERHADFVLVATGNTAGYGGTRGHAGRRAFDAATRERFAYITWTYDEQFEEKLTLAANPKAEGWLRWVQAVRAHCAQAHPDVVVSPRASIRGAELLRDEAVEGLEELADAVLFKGLEQAQRSRILSSCPLPRTEIN